MHEAMTRLLNKWVGHINGDGLTYVFPLGVDDDAPNWMQFYLWDLRTPADVCKINDLLEQYSTPGARF